LLIALREFHFECIEEQLDEQNELRDRGIDMTKLPTARRLLPIRSYSLSRMGEIYVFERPHHSFWFGCGLRATPLGSTFDAETFRQNILIRRPSKVLGREHDRDSEGAIGRNEMKIAAGRRPQNSGFCGCVAYYCSAAYRR
jgi:hypothetical protein